MNSYLFKASDCPWWFPVFTAMCRRHRVEIKEALGSLLSSFSFPALPSATWGKWGWRASWVDRALGGIGGNRCCCGSSPRKRPCASYLPPFPVLSTVPSNSWLDVEWLGVRAHAVPCMLLPLSSDSYLHELYRVQHQTKSQDLAFGKSPDLLYRRASLVWEALTQLRHHLRNVKKTLELFGT